MELPEMNWTARNVSLQVFIVFFLYFVSYKMKKIEFELFKKPEAGYAFAFTEVYFGPYASNFLAIWGKFPFFAKTFGKTNLYRLQQHGLPSL